MALDVTDKTTGVGADGRVWLIRCPRDPASLNPGEVQRFANTVRYLRRVDLAILMTAGPVASPILEATLLAGITVVDGESLDCRAALQNRRA